MLFLSPLSVYVSNLEIFKKNNDIVDDVYKDMNSPIEVYALIDKDAIKNRNLPSDKNEELN